MSTVTLPADFVPRSCNLRLQTNQRVNAAPFGGSEQAIDLLNDRWLMSAELRDCPAAEGAWREALIDMLRGQTNVVSLYHFGRPTPRGTVRGTLTLAASAAQGAASIQITGCSPSNGTLLAGDMLGVGGLLVRVGADASASGGVITVSLANRLRAAQSSGASVTWNMPTAPFRLLSTNGVEYGQGRAAATSFDFGEAIA